MIYHIYICILHITGSPGKASNGELVRAPLRLVAGVLLLDGDEELRRADADVAVLGDERVDVLDLARVVLSVKSDDLGPCGAVVLRVVGLINIQYAVIPDGTVYIIEANPRASRTVPYVAKAIGHPLAKYASLVMAGATLKDINFTEEVKLDHVAVKEAVLPFDKFPGADTLLGPEMRSTGEVMGIDKDFTKAYAKAQIAAGQRLPTKGKVFISVRDSDKAVATEVAKQFAEMGMTVVATGGTAKVIEEAGVPVTVAPKIHEGRPHIGDMLRNNEISLMIVTSSGDDADMKDGREIRRTAVGLKVPLVTTMAGAKATCNAVRVLQEGKLEMIALQDFF